MSFSYDPSTPLGQVRLLTIDFDGNNPIFQDNEISAFLTLNNQDVRLAAAMALDVIASNEAYVQKQIRTLDLSTNGVVTAKDLRDNAKELRRQVHEGDDGASLGMFDWAEQIFDEFTERERLEKQFLRESGAPIEGGT